MPTVTSEILFVGGRPPHLEEFEFTELDAQTAPTSTEFQESGARVVVLSMQNLTAQKIENFLRNIERHPRRVRVLLEIPSKEVNTQDVIRWLNTGMADEVVEIGRTEDFRVAMIRCLEKAGLDEQDLELQSLVEQQNRNLAKISADLEDRVLKRQKSLEQSKDKLLLTIRRDEALQKALIGLQKANSVIEMERVLMESLALDLGVTWVRILFQSQTSNFESTIARALENFTILKLSLEKDSDKLGSVFVARDKGKKFTDSEQEFLSQISRAAALTMDRMVQMTQLERVQMEWQATFNSIRQPVILVTKEYNLVRQNENFDSETQGPITGKKCYEALFSRTSPCPGCQLGSDFQLDPMSTAAGNLRVFRVSSTSMKMDFQNVFVNLYRDVSERLRLEKSILESAKTTELGLIGGSIAHELNNPMAGIMTFLQLLMMDLKGNEPYFSDIKEMQMASERSKEIIENLLNFARKEEMSATSSADLREILFRSLKIIEIKTKTMGIQIESPQSLGATLVKGTTNLVAQAVMNVLQAAIDRILIRKQDAKDRFEPRIHIGLFRTDDMIQLAFTDNGKGLGTAGIVSGLGLSVAQHILADFGGSLASYSISPTEHCVTIALQSAE